MSMASDIAVALITGLLLAKRNGDNSVPVEWGSGWKWPVAPIAFADGSRYAPEVSQEFKGAEHAGVDIMFRRRNAADRPAYPAGSENGNTRWFAPPGTPIVAARDGRVWTVKRTGRGWVVVLDHGKPFATFYTHLSGSVFGLHRGGMPLSGKTPTLVKAGQLLGRMGSDPMEARKPPLRHLHFAVWHKGSGDSASVDPERAMRSWSMPARWDVK